jgi:transketolase
LDKTCIQAVSKEPKATRAYSGEVLQKASELIPSLYGGSADLGYSTKTIVQGYSSISPGDFKGRNIHFGIREHAMGSILNGMALYGGFIPYGSTFFVFSDYMRPAIRMSALMKIRVIWIFTHDSIFVGEDGPTHQPIEHLAALRAIPNLAVFRPADGLETAMAWSYALRRKDGPTALCLTRQRVPIIHRPEGFNTDVILKGGYILSDSDGMPDVILVATGSEVSVAVEAKALLSQKGLDVRVVSMPSLTLFREQASTYRASVVPEKSIPVAVVEAGLAQGWHALTCAPLYFIGMSQFGTSAPYQALKEHFGITGSSVADRVGRWLETLSKS